MRTMTGYHTINDNSNSNNNINKRKYDHVDYYSVFEQNNLGVANLMIGDMKQAFNYLRNAFDQAKMYSASSTTKSTAAVTATNKKRKQQQGQQQQQLEGQYCIYHHYDYNKNNNESNGPLHCPSSSCPCPCPPRSSLNPLFREQLIQTLKSTASNNARYHGIMLSMSSFLPQQQQQDDAITSTAHIDMTLVSAFSIYNLGIVYGLGGYQDYHERSNDSLLVKSKMMFENCQQLLLRILSTTTSSGQQIHIIQDEEEEKGTTHQTTTRITTTTVLPTGNPLIDLLYLLTLTKLTEINSLLSDLRQVHYYGQGLKHFVHHIRTCPSYNNINSISISNSNDGLYCYMNDLEILTLMEYHCQRALMIVDFRRQDLPSLAPAA